MNWRVNPPKWGLVCDGKSVSRLLLVVKKLSPSGVGIMHGRSNRGIYAWLLVILSQSAKKLLHLDTLKEWLISSQSKSSAFIGVNYKVTTNLIDLLVLRSPWEGNFDKLKFSLVQIVAQCTIYYWHGLKYMYNCVAVVVYS